MQQLLRKNSAFIAHLFWRYPTARNWCFATPHKCHEMAPAKPKSRRSPGAIWLECAPVETAEARMLERTQKSERHNEDRHVAVLAILFGSAAVLLTLLAVVPEPAAALPFLALILMAQLTRMLGTRLFRDFTD